MKRIEARSKKREGCARRSGFAFTEVLFAVMVLGIGFIMIAAMFPVTIRQTQNTMQDTTAANEAQAAIAYLGTIGNDLNFPVTVPQTAGKPDPTKDGGIFSLQQTPYPPPASATTPPVPGYWAARGNFVVPNNPRFAWLPVYRRGAHLNGTVVVPDPFAQVFIFVMQSRNRPQYYPWAESTRPYSDFDVPPNAKVAFGTPPVDEVSTLSPRQLQVTVTYDAAALHGVLTIPNTLARNWAAPGAYVVIAADPNINLPLNRIGQSIGRIYQLGNPIDQANGVWNITPGTDMIRKGPSPATPIAGDDNDLTMPSAAYMIGRGYSNPLDAKEGYAGPTQDLAVYTGYIQISPDIHP